MNYEPRGPGAVDGPSGPGKSPRTRRVTSRAKTGCYTCKTRRVKCDERRPFCWRCASSGLNCGGYGVWGGGGHPTQPLAHCLSLCRPNNPGPTGCLGSVDRQTLKWFFRKMMAKLQGIFPSPFWEYLVPQACYGESVILHCVLALGSAHRNAVAIRNCTDSVIKNGNLELTTLRHYNAAIGMLNRLQSSKSRASARLTLIACLLFIAIEYLQKRHKQGLLHLQHGLQILRHQDKNNQSPRDSIDEWLAEAFSRLNIQARLLSNTMTEQGHLLDVAHDNANLVLGSLHQARTQLDILLTEALRLQSRGRAAESSVDVGGLFEALTTQKRLQQNLNTWLTAYRRWQAQSPWCSLEEQLARRVLLLYYIMAGIIASTALYPADESAFDQHASQFASIVTQSKDIFTAALPITRRRQPGGRETSPTPFSFSSDSGLLPPLYFTALKCRHSKIRRDALYILATETSQEGIWDASTAALVAAEVIRLEEAPHQQQGQTHDKEGVCHGSHYSPELGSLSPHRGRLLDIEVDLACSPEIELVLRSRQRSGDGTLTALDDTNGIFGRLSLSPERSGIVPPRLLPSP